MRKFSFVLILNIALRLFKYYPVMIVAGRKLSFFQKSFLDENPLRFFFYHDCFRRRTGSSERSRPVNDRYPPAALFFFPPAAWGAGPDPPKEAAQSMPAPRPPLLSVLFISFAKTSLSPI